MGLMDGQVAQPWPKLVMEARQAGQQTPPGKVASAWPKWCDCNEWRRRVLA